mgnify:CR=1 FL=1
MTPPADASQGNTLAIVLGAVTIISFALNAIQFLFNRAKERRLKNYEKFEYGAHLQVHSQEREIGCGTPNASFRYSGIIENCGLKTVHIKSVLLEYGSDKDSNKRYKFVMEREFYLKAGDQKEVQHEISADDVKTARVKFGIEDCHFSLGVSFIDPSGALREKELHLAYVGPNKAMFVEGSWIIA